MPLNRNWTSGTLPAAAASVNCGITWSVSISVGLTLPRFSVLKPATVSSIHFWMPTASCSPHHHILMLPPPPPPLALPLLPPEDALPQAPRIGAAPASAMSPPRQRAREVAHVVPQFIG